MAETKQMDVHGPFDAKFDLFLYVLYVEDCCHCVKPIDGDLDDPPLRVSVERFLPLTAAEVVEAAKKARQFRIYFHAECPRGLLFLEELEPGEFDTLSAIQTEHPGSFYLEDEIVPALAGRRKDAEFFDGLMTFPDLDVTLSQLGEDVDAFTQRITAWWERFKVRLIAEMEDGQRPSQEEKWEKVSSFLKKLRSRGTDWTSYEDMAKRAGVAVSTVHKAVQRTPVLKIWATEGASSKVIPGVRSMDGMVADTVKAESMDPSEAAAINTDSLLSRLTEAATLKQRAQLNAMGKDQVEAMCREFERTGEVTVRGDKIKLVNRRP